MSIMTKIEDDPTTLFDWFKKNYPMEFDLQNEIARRADKKTTFFCNIQPCGLNSDEMLWRTAQRLISDLLLNKSSKNDGNVMNRGGDNIE